MFQSGDSRGKAEIWWWHCWYHVIEMRTHGSLAPSEHGGALNPSQNAAGCGEDKYDRIRREKRSRLRDEAFRVVVVQSYFQNIKFVGLEIIRLG
jgi:hypothetical protein